MGAKRTGLLIAMAGIFFIFTSAYGEVYRWLDDNGKMHYSDKKPATSAQDITAEIDNTNIDTSIAEQRKLQQILRPKNAADRAYEHRRQQQDQPSRAQINYCNQRRNYLHAISGRVQLLDDSGNAVKFTERERQTRVQQIKQEIVQNCAAL